MKKALITMFAGLGMVAVSILIFIAALSVPNVSGPSFMRTLWLLWTFIGLAVTAVGGAATAVCAFKKIKKNSLECK